MTTDTLFTRADLRTVMLVHHRIAPLDPALAEELHNFGVRLKELLTVIGAYDRSPEREAAIAAITGR